MTARFDFRLDAPLVAPNSGVGLMILETYEKLTGVWARSEGVELVLDSVAGGEVADRRDLDARLTPGTVYTLAVSIDGDGGMHARLCETESGRTLAELCGATTVHPHGLALAVDEPSGVAVQAAIDNVRVEAGAKKTRRSVERRVCRVFTSSVEIQGFRYSGYCFNAKCVQAMFQTGHNRAVAVRRSTASPAASTSRSAAAGRLGRRLSSRAGFTGFDSLGRRCLTTTAGRGFARSSFAFGGFCGSFAYPCSGGSSFAGRA